MLKQVTPGTGLPVTLAQLKASCNCNTTDDDTLISDLGYEIVDFIERETGKVLRPEVWSETFDAFPGAYYYGSANTYPNCLLPPRMDNPVFRPSGYWDYWKIRFDKLPVTAVDSVTYFDATNTSTPLNSSQYYFVSPTYLPAFIAPVSSWPATYIRPDAVVVQYHVGWSTLPPLVSGAVRSLVATRFRYPEAFSEKSTKEVGLGIERILARIRNI